MTDSTKVKVTVNHGANGKECFVVAGTTIESLYNQTNELYNLPKKEQTEPTVTGLGKVAWNHKLTGGEIIQFQKVSGDKG